jgi:hypothetical protein
MYKFEINELKPKNIELVFKEFYNEFPDRKSTRLNSSHHG